MFIVHWHGDSLNFLFSPRREAGADKYSPFFQADWHLNAVSGWGGSDITVRLEAEGSYSGEAQRRELPVLGGKLNGRLFASLALRHSGRGCYRQAKSHSHLPCIATAGHLKTSKCFSPPFPHGWVMMGPFVNNSGRTFVTQPVCWVRLGVRYWLLVLSDILLGFWNGSGLLRLHLPFSLNMWVRAIEAV